jgi:hypothetical protein
MKAGSGRRDSIVSDPPARGRRWLGPTIAVMLILGGCGTSSFVLTRPAPETLPAGSPLRVTTLPDADAWLRHHLVSAQPDGALTLLAVAGEEWIADKLLRALQQALVSRAAGEFARSNELLEWADAEIDRRRTRSVSESAGTFLLNDRVAGYLPSRSEVAMLPYYRMMNYLALGDVGGAAVEARRIGALLEGHPPDEVRCMEDGMLRHLAALAFESSGELNDALVSLRQAERRFDACAGDTVAAPSGFGRDLERVASRLGFSEIADSARARYEGAVHTRPLNFGEVVVIVERGFVAHLREDVIHVPIFEADIDELESGDVEGIAKATAVIAARLANNFAERGYWGDSRDDRLAVQVAQGLSGAHVLRLAWASSEEPEGSAVSMHLIAGARSAEVARWGNLSALVPQELDSKRAAALGRLLTRSLIRFLLARELEKKAEEEGGEVLGFVTGRLANLAGNGLERADTRSWTLLPDEIHIGRIALPEGTHQLRLESFPSDGAGRGVVEIGSVDVKAGRVTIINRRSWSDGELSASSGLELAKAAER